MAYPGSDNDVKLVGSFGSYELKIDKTVPTKLKSVYLMARTRGLISIE